MCVCAFLGKHKNREDMCVFLTLLDLDEPATKCDVSMRESWQVPTYENCHIPGKSLS